ncbi:hypothetical protein AWH56_002580 [Anaerobacillus isosaccharinicus]|uniref:Uncharacterized protein n=1 Tax=Anaerobacillus isosaccharinicus TaxID=1532552 RepID=A0A7S7RDX5_9BACI|nr:hypothetical protein [Anaerobacillus isosaccharinicus]QOY38465.1 hypothetical protein AWH56_002580 [Anaerobacillus isosaccharinicus]
MREQYYQYKYEKNKARVIDWLHSENFKIDEL